MFAKKKYNLLRMPLTILFVRMDIVSKKSSCK